MPYCRHCGRQVDEQNKYCPICGEKVNSTPEQTEIESAGQGNEVTGTPGKRISRAPKIALLVGIASVAAFSVAFLVLVNARNKNTQESIAAVSAETEAEMEAEAEAETVSQTAEPEKPQEATAAQQEEVEEEKSEAEKTEERRESFAKILQQYEAEYGEASILTWGDMEVQTDAYPNSKGVYYADLIDFDGSGREALVIGYRNANSKAEDEYSLDVWECEDEPIRFRVPDSMLWYGVDGGSICYYVFEDEKFLVANPEHSLEASYYGRVNGMFSEEPVAVGKMPESGGSFYDAGKGEPEIEECYIYGVSDSDREKLMQKLYETKNELGIESAKADGIPHEVQLRRTLLNSLPAGEEMLFLIYDDYDGDGTFEAFAATSPADNNLFCNLYYITTEGRIENASQQQGLSDFLYEDASEWEVREYYFVETKTQKFLVWENSAGGSGSTSFVFGVRGGGQYEPAISGAVQGFGQSDAGEYVSYEDDFSQGFHDHVRVTYSFVPEFGEFVPN